MKERLFALARGVREAVLPHLRCPSRRVVGRADGGDPHFDVDEVAEETTVEILRSWDVPVAYFSEDRGLVRLAADPEVLVVVDPIDGTRPALAGFESCCFSAVALPYRDRPTFREVRHAIVLELGSGDSFYADASAPGIASSRPDAPRPSGRDDLAAMFWSIELTAHPVDELMRVYGHLVDGSVTRGAVFVFTSSSYSLTRLATGQLDGHVDVGHRILRDRPELLPKFLEVGRGKVVTLFPYDIAAGAFIAQKAGATVTDAYGQPLDDLCLFTDKSLGGQCSIVAASNPRLHAKLLASLRWAPPTPKGGSPCAR